MWNKFTVKSNIVVWTAACVLLLLHVLPFWSSRAPNGHLAQITRLTRPGKRQHAPHAYFNFTIVDWRSRVDGREQESEKERERERFERRCDAMWNCGMHRPQRSDSNNETINFNNEIRSNANGNGKVVEWALTRQRTSNPKRNRNDLSLNKMCLCLLLSRHLLSNEQQTHCAIGIATASSTEWFERDSVSKRPYDLMVSPYSGEVCV